MDGYYYSGLVFAVGVASLLSSVRCDVNCKGAEGHLGLPGGPGRDGWPGEKGQKGEPAQKPEGPADQRQLLKLKGEMGSQGAQGPTGPKGYHGTVGVAGLSGAPGPKGPDGKSTSLAGAASGSQTLAAFSAIRTDSNYPHFAQKVKYQETVVSNPNFDQATGEFTCSTPGYYYFTFHSVAKVSMCLAIGSEALRRPLVFCDFNRARLYDQVLSGGAVLQLARGEKVWLESVNAGQVGQDSSDTREKRVIFNGFLLFSNPE
ncbi:uncharacterized protein ACNS7B_005912 [Menidia menidia]